MEGLSPIAQYFCLQIQKQIPGVVIYQSSVEGQTCWIFLRYNWIQEDIDVVNKNIWMQQLQKIGDFKDNKMFVTMFQTQVPVEFSNLETNAQGYFNTEKCAISIPFELGLEGSVSTEKVNQIIKVLKEQIQSLQQAINYSFNCFKQN